LPFLAPVILAYRLVVSLQSRASAEEIKNEVLANVRWWAASRSRTAAGTRRRPELVPDCAKGTPLDQAGNIDTGRASMVSWLQERAAR